eukprot:scaffold442_cov397-Prasinococcus_capsulatus_cf.AAC.43
MADPVGRHDVVRLVKVGQQLASPPHSRLFQNLHDRRLSGALIWLRVLRSQIRTLLDSGGIMLGLGLGLGARHGLGRSSAHPAAPSPPQSDPCPVEDMVALHEDSRFPESGEFEWYEPDGQDAAKTRTRPSPPGPR